MFDFKQHVMAIALKSPSPNLAGLQRKLKPTKKLCLHILSLCYILKYSNAPVKKVKFTL
jgi:hypothetical protein